MSTLRESEREAALERVAIMVVENEWPEWLARAVVMGGGEDGNGVSPMYTYRHGIRQSCLAQGVLRG